MESLKSAGIAEVDERARQRDEIRRAVQSHEVPAPAPAARARLARSALSVILSVSAGVALRRARAAIVQSPRAAGVVLKSGSRKNRRPSLLV